MSQEGSTPAQLLDEIVYLRERVALLEQCEADRSELYRSLVEGSPH